MTKSEIIEKTIVDLEHHTTPRPVDPETRQCIIEVITERLPDGVDIKTCEDFKHLNVECCEVCHTFMAESEMWVRTLPDGSTAWICDGTLGAVVSKNGKGDAKDAGD